ncbi:MAG TPA: hypothetical protein HPP56_05635 [Nitrospirae bacterium]|nr:hypothetical protein [Nitrospirota bacterium]
MATTNKKAMSMGIFLALNFFGVLFLIFMPIFGDGKNGLVFSDDMFNKLSKGSSYFIPDVKKSADNFLGKEFTLTIKMDREEQIKNTVQVLTVANMVPEATGTEIKIKGKLGELMAIILKDSDDMYKNDGKAISAKYNLKEKEVMLSWWNILKQMDKSFKKEGKIEEAKIATDVMKKAVETAYNFYGIEAQKVTDKAIMMIGLLIFYVIYTMWWGFAIYYLFEGLGLSMSKVKH